MANILIIDDQPHLGEMLSSDLSEDGHCVTCVAEVRDAMEKLRLCRPDIVLLDLYLQGFEGWDVLHRLKLIDSRIPVLIVTAYDNFIDDPRLAEADGYVIKSVCTDNLKGKIKELLTSNRATTKERHYECYHFRQRRQNR